MSENALKLTHKYENFKTSRYLTALQVQGKGPEGRGESRKGEGTEGIGRGKGRRIWIAHLLGSD